MSRVLVLLAVLSGCLGWHPYDTSCDEPFFEAELNEDTTTLASTRTVELSIPFAVLRDFWVQSNLWPTWNGAYTYVQNKNLTLCDRLIANFTDVPKPWNPGPQNGHPIVVWQKSVPNVSEELNWKYNVPNVLFGRHDTSIFAVGQNVSALYSWEKAYGLEIDEYNFYFRFNFETLLSRYITGARCLESVYRAQGQLDPVVVSQKCKPQMETFD